MSADEFSETENDNIVIVSTGAGNVSTGDNYIIRDASGVITGLRKNNSELSFSYLSENYFSELPDKNCEVNGNNIVINEKRLSKTQKISLEIPLKNISEIDLSEKVKYLTDYAKIDNISRAGNNNFTKLELIK